MKKYIIFIFIMLLTFLSACSASYSDNAFYEVNDLQKTDYKKVTGSQFRNLEVDGEFNQALLDFSYKTASELLEDRNGMYSPISYYIALSELAELTGGDTRGEILSALNIDDIQVLREGNQNLYKKLTYVNKISTLRIANSIWLNKFESYKDEPLAVLRDKYYASSYGVDFSKTEDKKSIGDWVSDNTGGKLGSNDFDDLDASVVFVLLNTIYFYDEWGKKFDKSKNEMGSFSGLITDVEYMNQELDGYYFKDDEYEASTLKFKNGLNIKFVAPLDSDKFREFVNNENKLKASLSEKLKVGYLVNYRIPKFTYKSSFELIDYAKTLGINKVFTNADFSPLTNASVNVSAMYQKSFIEIDEEGGKAAVYTGIIAPKSAAPAEKITFNLNRPFVYAIYSGDYPLFIGTVTNPASDVEQQYK